MNYIEASTTTRDLYTAGFLYGPEEANRKRWKGIRVLGSGSSAVVALWIKRDHSNNPEQVIKFLVYLTRFRL
jgi:hypothetical protein